MLFCIMPLDGQLPMFILLDWKVRLLVARESTTDNAKYSIGI